MALLGPRTTSALHRFERHPLVLDVRVHWDRLRVEYSTGIHEVWSLDHGDPRRLVLPRGGWWRYGPGMLQEYADPTALLCGDVADDGPMWCMPYSEFAKGGFLDQRLGVHRALDRLLDEGWIEPEVPFQALDEDLVRLRRALIDGHVTSRGFIRQQVEGMRSPPPGFSIACSATRWGDHEEPGRPSLRSSFTSRRIYWAIESCLARRRNLTRVNLIHGLTTGSSFGVASRVGARTTAPTFWLAVFRHVCGVTAKPIVVDHAGNVGFVAAAVVASGGRYLYPVGLPIRDGFAAWADRHGVEIVVDDGSTSDVGLLGDLRGRGQSEIEYVINSAHERCASTVALVSREEGESLRSAFPQADLLRFRRWQFNRDDQALFVLHQQ
jgi:hypothetical protein